MYYVADFETNTLTEEQERAFLNKEVQLKDLQTRVWGYGLCEVGEVEDIDVGNSIDMFMSKVGNIPNNRQTPTIFFHNLKFDGMFIIDWLFKKGYVYDGTRTRNKSFTILMNDMGVMYSIEILEKKYRTRRKGFKFQDSLKKLPFTVDKIAKAFNLDFKKVEVDQDFYKLQRGEDYKLTVEDIYYIKNDVRVISQALQILFNQGMKQMTIGSDALTYYKTTIGNKWNNWFPILEREVDDDIKLSYKGGVALLKESIRGLDIGYGRVFDINSMYPSIMRYKKLPYGKPLFYVGEYKQFEDYDLYIQQLSCEFKIKKDHLPTIQIKGEVGRYKPNEYIEESKGPTTLYLTSVDLDLFFEHYNVYNIEWFGGYMFKSRTDMFIDYIDHWTEIKETSVGAMRQLAKLMLNSLYGKFGSKTFVKSKTALINEKGLVGFKLGEIEEIDPVYTAVASFVTSYGRSKLLTTAQLNYDRFCYCDTDSVHLQGLEDPIGIEMHKTKLGLWDDEGTFKQARFLGAKCYVEDFIAEGDKKAELKVVCAGMTKRQHSQVTYENFREGLRVTGKLSPKIVNGGVVLVDIPYEVKVRGWGRF